MQKQWMGRHIAQESDHEHLERLAAHKQFREGLQRSDADAAAYDEYKRETHEKAAAHHVDSMKHAMSSGANDVAQKHHGLYLAHMRKLGHKGSMVSPPHEVQRHITNQGHREITRFVNHPGDGFLVK